MLLFCRKNLSLVQRKAMNSLVGVMGAAVSLTILFRESQPVGGLLRSALLVSVVETLPLLALVVVIARYLRQETDEFVRALVVRALLCGFAFTIVADGLIGSLMNLYAFHLPWTLLNLDLFCAGAMVSFRVLRRAYR